MSNKKTILLIAASLFVGVLMPYLTKFAVLIIRGREELSFLLKGAFSHAVLVYYLKMGIYNAVPFIILALLFLDTNRMRARSTRQEAAEAREAYLFSLKVAVLFACYVTASSLYINITSLLNGFSIVPRMYIRNIIICIAAFVASLVATNRALKRSVSGG